MHKITIKPDNIELLVKPDQTILEAGIGQSLNLPHGCRNGMCGACKCKILDGAVMLKSYNEGILTRKEIDEGYTLLCRVIAKTDVVLDIPNISKFSIQVIPVKVIRKELIGKTAVITLQLPKSQKFIFYAGQYIEIMFDGKKRSYSIAGSCSKSSQIELHIRYHPGGAFSEFVWHKLQLNSALRLRGPFGTFGLKQTNSTVILVCTGTGFAPIKAILDDMSENFNPREICLYWGNRTVADFYLLELLAKWQQQLNIDITLCTSQERNSDYFYGYVTDALKQDYIDLSNYELYVCGNLQMVTDVYDFAIKANLAKTNFVSDAFTPYV